MQGASEKVAKKRVKFTGDDALKIGYAVCYNRDSTTGNSAGAEDLYRAWEVEKPATANLKDFAGLVANDYSAVTGGQMIEIIEPRRAGTVCRGYAGVACTLGTTKLAIQNATYTLEAAGSSNVTVALANQTVDRSSTEGICQVILTGANVTDIDEAALVTPTQVAVTAPTGATTGGTAKFAVVDLTAPVGATTGGTVALAVLDLTAPSGGTTGGTTAMENIPGAGYSAAEVANIENNFSKAVAALGLNGDDHKRFQVALGLNGDDHARIAKELNAVKVDVAAIITSLQNANIMATS
jgi:hypothetical protein